MTTAAAQPFDYSYLKNRYNDFKDRKLNLSYEELGVLKDQLSDLGGPTSFLDTLLANFSSIDANEDGLSVDELKGFTVINALGGGPSAQGAPLTVSKAEVNSITSRITALGGEPPKLLQTIVENFDNIDADKDGRINTNELLNYADEEDMPLGLQTKKKKKHGLGGYVASAAQSIGISMASNAASSLLLA